MTISLFPATDKIRDLLNEQLAALETRLGADFLCQHGPIIDGNETLFLRIVEQIANEKKHDTLYVCLTTTGGSATAVERYVNIIRGNYKEVNFIIPDYAYSAGTIYCMSGDNILMDYSSVLGPIDPQVPNKEGRYVPALGYLDKVKELLDKAQAGTISQAEFLILKDLDLAELRRYEQAKELTIDLLKKWLVKYKFKNWVNHQTDENLKGQEVTDAQKIKRAEEIADKLSDNKIWKSHSRPINMEALRDIRLVITDYGEDRQLQKLIRDYHYLVIDFIKMQNFNGMLHTRRFL